MAQRKVNVFRATVWTEHIKREMEGPFPGAVADMYMGCTSEQLTKAIERLTKMRDAVLAREIERANPAVAA